MTHISELEKTLAQFFNWNKSRLNCLVQILRAILCFRTVNLARLVPGFQTDVKQESVYRRICRFFTNFSFDLTLIFRVVQKLFPIDGTCLLVLDRTNWKLGKTPINILMLSVAYRGISIPLFWSALNLDGTSSLDDRVSLLKRAMELLGTEKIEALVADREFIGKKWFKHLIKHDIPFAIRIKQNMLAKGIRKDQTLPVRVLCRDLGLKKKIINQFVTLGEHQLYVSVRRGKAGGEPMIIASNRKFKDPFDLYKRRWEIETLFGCLKSRGFFLEDTHMTDPDKIEKLLFVLTIAFCWAYRIGDIRSTKEPIPLKSHGRLAKSLFREGLNAIQRVILSIQNRLSEHKTLLSCFGLRCRSA